MAPTARSRDRDPVLSSVLKALRLHRRLTVLEVAKRMGLGKRSYERFEAGEGLLKVERIFSFAQATNTDPYALLASVKLGAADFALACADNKLALLFMAHAREFFLRQGQDIGQLRSQFLVEVFNAAFGRLDSELADLRALAAKWGGLPPPDDQPED
jgi:transcriptional regulator with XRE-family HTH domain